MTEKELHQIIHEILTSEQTLKESARTLKRLERSRRLTEAVPGVPLLINSEAEDDVNTKHTKMLLNHLDALHQQYDYKKVNQKMATGYFKLGNSLELELMTIPKGRELIIMNFEIVDSLKRNQTFVERTDAFKRLRDAAGIDNTLWVGVSMEKFKLYEPYGYQAGRDERLF